MDESLQKRVRRLSAEEVQERFGVSTAASVDLESHKSSATSRRILQLCAGRLIAPGTERPLGFNDGVVRPRSAFPSGLTDDQIRRLPRSPTPIRGVIRVAVILVDFSDQEMTKSKQEIENIFRDIDRFYREVSGDLVSIQADLSPTVYRLPETSEHYSGPDEDGGIHRDFPNTQTLANDAVQLAIRDNFNFSAYDNDGDSYVDGLVILHSARDEKAPGGLWSAQWWLPEDDTEANGKKIYAFAAVSQHSLFGTFCHELGHLLFNWPDLIDTHDIDERGDTLSAVSLGIGDWCLMGTGMWLGNPDGSVPGHPCAWLKHGQGWIDVETPNPGDLTVEPIQTGRKAYRFWNTEGGSEYFLAESRRKSGFDRSLPQEGLVIYHINEIKQEGTNKDFNDNPFDMLIRVEQADGHLDIEHGIFGGDDGDVFPGNSKNTSFTSSSIPASHSSTGSLTGISLRNIAHGAAGRIELSYSIDNPAPDALCLSTDGTHEATFHELPVTGHLGSQYTAVVAMDIGSTTSNALVAYDPSGRLAFFEIDQSGQINLMVETDADPATDHVTLLSGDFGGGTGKLDLLLFDPAKDQQENVVIYSASNSLGLTPRHLGTRLTHRNYSTVAAGDFGKHSGRSDLVFYDPFREVLDFYLVDDNGDLSNFSSARSQRDPDLKAPKIAWRAIVPGSFGGGPTTDLFFYDPKNNSGEFWQTNPFAPIGMPTKPDDRYDKIAQIAPGSFFSSSPHTSLAFLDVGDSSRKPSIWFYKTDGHGDLLNTYTAWEIGEIGDNWHVIVPGHFGGSRGTDLFFHKR